MRQNNGSVAALAFLLAFCLAMLVVPVSAGPKLSTTSIRILQFPEGHSLGAVRIVPHFTGFVDNSAVIHSAGAAKGSIKVSVPDNAMVLLELNRYALDHPSEVEKISPRGIDAIRIQFMSMEDSGNASDAVVKQLRHFTEVTELILDRSDVTDRGFESLKGMNNLQLISAFDCYNIHGTFLRDLPLPNLIALNLGANPIDKSSFAYLKQLPKLQCLAIDTHSMGAEQIKQIGLCHSLVILNICGAHTLNDQTVSYLLGLKNLKFLDINDTAVSTTGLKKLVPLKLTGLALPEVLSDEAMADLKKAFPHTVLTAIPKRGKGDVDKDVQDIFKPLK